MATVRKVTAEEASTWVAESNSGSTGKRAATREAYNALIADYNVGDHARFDLDAGEKVLTVRNNIVAAAKRRNMGVNFHRAKRGERDSVVTVTFIPASVEAAVVEASE